MFTDFRWRRVTVGAALTIALTGALTGGADAHELAGTLVERHGDSPGAAETDRSFAVETADGELALHDPQPASLVGQEVVVPAGRPAAGGIAGRVRAASEARLAAAAPTGPHTLLVVMATLADVRETGFGIEEVREAVFTGRQSASSFFVQQSQGSVWLTGRMRADGDVAGWFDLPVSSAGCDEDAIAAAADGAARRAGIEPDTYDHVMYVIPHVNACDWAGMGAMPGRRTWINGNLSTYVLAHELGHNMGADHASSLRCADPQGATRAVADACTEDEYGDPLDVMGRGWFALMSSWNRIQLGQLPAAQSQAITQSGTYELAGTNDTASPGPRLILVPRKDPGRPVTSYFALELRTPGAPFDEFALEAPVINGVTVRRVPRMTAGGRSYLVDGTPETARFGDAPLVAGREIRDEAYGIAIQVTRVEAGRATVEITMPPFRDDVPPSAPLGVRAAGDTRSVSLGWQAAEDDERIDHYEIERDGVILATTPGLHLDDARLDGRRTVTYRVVAVDTSANRTASAPLRLRLNDGVAPIAPRQLKASKLRRGVRLAWTPGTDDRGVVKYVLRRDGRALSTTRGRVIFDRRVRRGRHRWSVRAVDAAGNQSAAKTVTATVR